jgi:hypothetical protein
MNIDRATAIQTRSRSAAATRKGRRAAHGSAAFDLKPKPSNKKYCPKCGYVMDTDYDTKPDGSMIAEWVCIDCGHYEPKPLNADISDRR